MVGCSDSNTLHLQIVSDENIAPIIVVRIFFYEFHSRNSDGLTFKAVHKCHECVVFNAPQGDTSDTAKSYIVHNDVKVLDRKRIGYTVILYICPA